MEQDLGSKVSNSVIHWELFDIWKMIETLDNAIQPSERPSSVQILRSLADQRQAIAGEIVKDPLECKIAAVSCQNLEELYRQELTRSHQEGSMLTGVDDTLRTIVNKAARIVNEYLG